MNTKQNTPTFAPCQLDLDELEAWHAARDIESLASLANYWDMVANYVYSNPDLHPLEGRAWQRGLSDILHNRPTAMPRSEDYRRGMYVGFAIVEAAELLNHPEEHEEYLKVTLQHPDYRCLPRDILLAQ